MSRRHFAFDCAGSALAATLDEGSSATGLLMVTGGNETRAGAFSSQARLAAAVAAAGHPVMRFDRRGVGDSEGVNMGFRNEAEDIAAARGSLSRRNARRWVECSRSAIATPPAR